jgi:hypothetical protein
LIADTVKIPLIESDVFRLGDKACRNAARTADFNSRRATAEVESFLVNIGARFEGRRMTAASSRSSASRAIERRPPERSLAQDRDQSRHIVAVAVRAKRCERRPKSRTHCLFKGRRSWIDRRCAQNLKEHLDCYPI